MSLMGVVLLSFSSSQPLYIGLAGPMSGKGVDYGLSMNRGLSLAIDEYNRAGGYNGQKVELVVADDQNDKNLGPDAARQLVNAGIIAVVGHYYSSVSMAALPVYDSAGVPMITPSATNPKVTRMSQWAFRVSFDDDFQGAFVARYAHDVMGMNTAIVVHDADAYGTGLSKAFAQGAQSSGLELVKEYSFVPDSGYDFVDQLAHDTADVIFLAAHAPHGPDIIKRIREAGIDITIIGPDAFGGKAFLKNAQGPWFEGMICCMPLIYDVAGEEALVFKDAFRSRYNEEPDWVAAYSYDAGRLILRALDSVGPDPRGIRDYLASMNTPERALIGPSGLTYFNENRTPPKPAYMGVLSGGKFMSAPLQVVPLPEGIEDRGRRVLAVGKGRFGITHVVYTGINMVEVSELDIRNRTFVADFYLWFRWSGDLDPTGVEFTRAEIWNKDLRRSWDQGGKHYRLFRVKGKFTTSFPLQSYPFDTQNLRISFKHPTLSSDRVMFVVDRDYIPKTLPKIGFANWNTLWFRQFVEFIPVSASFGDPMAQNANTEQTLKFVSYNAVLCVQRNTIPFLIKFLLPLIIVIFMSFLVFYIHPDELEARAGIDITALLSAMAFHLSQGENLPNVGYMVIADKYFLSSYALIFAATLETIVVHYLNVRNKHKQARWIDVISRGLFPAATVIVGLVLAMVAR